MKPIILFDDAEPFKDRNEAGRKLGFELEKMIKERPIVLGIPRGGMQTAAAIASVLSCDIDIMLTHKIGAPYNSELAIGAMSEEGKIFLNERMIKMLDVDASYIEAEKQKQLNELERRQKLFRSIYPKISLKNRIVVITDDGVATGATVQVALWVARQEKPKKLIGAFPVAPPDTLKKLSHDADEIVCLKAPETFQALSQFYLNFNQVSDEEVLDILRNEIQRKKKRGETCVTH